jgi:hypothetical protein
MLASELIAQLSRMVDRYGDRNVATDRWAEPFSDIAGVTISEDDLVSLGDIAPIYITAREDDEDRVTLTEEQHEQLLQNPFDEEFYVDPAATPAGYAPDSLGAPKDVTYEEMVADHEDDDSAEAQGLYYGRN